MKLNCLVIDDEPVAQDILRDYIADTGFLTFAGAVDNPVKASALLSGGAIDLLFLDINMPKVNGIEFLQLARSLPPVVMTTAYSEYALESYEWNVLDYLLKPFSFERFSKAANKAKAYYEEKRSPSNDTTNENYFFVKSEGRLEKIIYEYLVCVEAMQNYVVLHTTSGKKIVYLTLKMMEQQLPKSAFVKIHKSMIVNLHRIKSISGKVIDLGTMQATISQNFFDDAMNEITGGRLLKR